MLVTKTIFAKYINFIKIQDSLDSLRFFASHTLTYFSMKKGSELKLRLLMKWHHLNFFLNTFFNRNADKVFI